MPASRHNTPADHERSHGAARGAGAGAGGTVLDEAGLDQLWQRLVDHLGQGANAKAVRAWLAPTGGQVRLVAADNEKLVVECPTPLFVRIIRDRYATALEQAATQALGHGVRVQCRVSSRQAAQHRERVQQVADHSRSGAAAAGPGHAAVASAPVGGWGQGFKQLDDFIVGSCNRLAHDAVRRLLDHQRGLSGPVFIHGSSGLGKTHLEQGLAMAYRERHPTRTVAYMRCEQFTNEYVSACEQGSPAIKAFRMRLRHADLLLIDDIHFLRRGQMTRTKDELFATISEMSDNGKQVVITSDAHPVDIKYLEDRFVQRFTGGLVVGLERPDLPLRREVVQAKAKTHAGTLPDEVVAYIAEHITDNMRELEGAVQKVLAWAESFQRPIDLHLARQALADVINRDEREPRLKVILRAVADYFDLSVEEICSKSRSDRRCTARHIAIYVLKQSGADTYVQVGQAFGMRSHSTVTHACEKVARLRATDREMDRFVGELLLRLRVR